MTSTLHPDHDPIPDITTALDPFGSIDELRNRWRALLGPLGFAEQVLWFVFIDVRGRIIPALNQVPLPATPDADLAQGLLRRLADVIDGQPSVRVALLITRPGTDATTPADRRWARLFIDAARESGVAMEPVFRANATDVVHIATHPDAVRSVA